MTLIELLQEISVIFTPLAVGISILWGAARFTHATRSGINQLTTHIDTLDKTVGKLSSSILSLDKSMNEISFKLENHHDRITRIEGVLRNGQ